MEPSLPATLPRLVSHRHELDPSPEAFGFLRESNDALDDVAELRSRIAHDGYIFLRGLLDREQVLDARRVCCERMAAAGLLDPSAPVMDAVAHPDKEFKFMPQLAEGNGPLMKMLYDGPMIAFLRRFLGGQVRHFDYTWFRAISPGIGTAPHMDSVYMGRGTQNLYTAWTPIGDVPLETGGLIVLEGSNRVEKITRHYARKDVDEYCENKPLKDGHPQRADPNFGMLARDPARLRRNLKLRWLTAEEYRAGDLLLFHIHTVHASLDNFSNSVRLSSDSRYQRADEPVDERWISIDGRPPINHSIAAKRGRIC